MGAALIEAANEQAPVSWVRSILGAVGNPQRVELHYRELKPRQKPIACREMAKLPVSLFAMLSNKKNMRRHRNERAAAKGNPLTSKQVFYNFCIRLLLERVTHCVLSHSIRTYGEARRVKIAFSRRDGHSYGHTFAYNEILKVQSRAGTTFLNKRTVRWEVMDYNLLEIEAPSKNAGLQIADVVASPFYQAVDILPPTLWNPENARLLKPRMARYRGRHENYGVTFVPYRYHEAELLPDQIDIFDFYGFHRFDFHKR